MVRGILSVVNMSSTTHHRVAISSPLHMHSSSLHSFRQIGKPRRCDSPPLQRNRCDGEGWVPWRVVAAVARGSTASCACFWVICGDELKHNVCLFAPRASGVKSSRTLARELAMECAPCPLSVPNCHDNVAFMCNGSLPAHHACSTAVAFLCHTR
jgi:hypothetical protein